MLTRLSSVFAARFWAALLVLTIAFHASVPVGAPLDVRSGSAFSADTVDVAVAPARRAAAEITIAAPLPPLMPVQHAVTQPAIPARFAAATHRWPDPTGPPAARLPLARNLAPRAPPTA